MMARSLFMLVLLPVLVSAANDPFAQDRAAIYRAFLSARSKEAKGPLLVKSKLIPLDLTSYDKKGCLSGIDFIEAPSTSETLDEKMISNTGYSLDDKNPDKGIAVGLSLSEIRFDAAHHYAAMRFRFICGPLCGNGTTVIFEKIEGQWSRTKRYCGAWVS